MQLHVNIWYVAGTQCWQRLDIGDCMQQDVAVAAVSGEERRGEERRGEERRGAEGDPELGLSFP